MKKFLTFVLVLAMVMSVSSFAMALDVSNITDLTDACKTSNEIVLTGDVEIATSIKIGNGVDIILDLNGKKLTGPDDGSSNWYAFIIDAGGKLTLKDSVGGGQLYAKCYGIETKGGTFVMESGKIDATKNSGIGAAVVNYGGTVIINGGELKASYAAVNAQSYFADVELEINNAVLSSTNDPEIVIGGEYSKGNEEAVINNGVNADISVKDALVATIDGTTAVGAAAIQKAAEANPGKTVKVIQTSSEAEKNELTLPEGTQVEVVDPWANLPAPPSNSPAPSITVNDKPVNAGESYTVPVTQNTTKPSSGSGISVKYNGGNSFSTSNPAVPTGVEIDGVPVTFNGTGSNFSVGCISSDAKWVTVRWNSTSVTTNFTPDGLVECTTVSIPKTGDMSIWAVIAQLLGF